MNLINYIYFYYNILIKYNKMVMKTIEKQNKIFKNFCQKIKNKIKHI